MYRANIWTAFIVNAHFISVASIDTTWRCKARKGVAHHILLHTRATMMRQCGRTTGLIPCLLCVYSCLTRSVFYSVYRLIDRSVLLPYPICLPLWYAQLNLLHMEEENCEEMGGNWALRRPKHRPPFYVFSHSSLSKSVPFLKSRWTSFEMGNMLLV